MTDNKNSQNNYSLIKKAWIVSSIFALIGLIILFFKATISIFILILVGVLIACYFRGLGNIIQKKTKLSSGISLLVSVLGSILFF